VCFHDIAIIISVSDVWVLACAVRVDELEKEKASDLAPSMRLSTRSEAADRKNTRMPCTHVKRDK
jgi:hypothetical protein